MAKFASYGYSTVLLYRQFTAVRETPDFGGLSRY
jgi:hypothetical protein